MEQKTCVVAVTTKGTFQPPKKIAKVEEYKECLDNESKGVTEVIEELKSK